LGSVTDLCYQCKLCFNHCPYTPSTERLTRIEFPETLRSVFLSRSDLAVEREDKSLYARALAPEVQRRPLSSFLMAGYLMTLCYQTGRRPV
jgi:hypothetical protein